MDIPVIVVDSELRIRRFAGAESLFDFREQDIGRKLSDLALRIELDDLEGLVRRAIKDLSSVERQVTDREGHWYTMSVRPYRSVDNRIEGAIISLIPSEELRRTSDRLDEKSRELTRRKVELKSTEDRFRALVTTSFDTIYSMSPDWSVMRHLNSIGFLSDTTEPNENWLEDYIYPEDQPRVLAAINEAIKTKGVFELEHRIRRRDGSPGWTYSRAVPILNQNGDIEDWIGAASDTTEGHEAEKALRQNEPEQGD